MLRKLVSSITFAIAFATIVIIGSMPATAADVVEQDTFLPVPIDGRIYRLEAYIVRPARAVGRLPVALIAHGRPVVGEYRQKRARDVGTLAREIARRGYLAVVVVRRGFGRSDGVHDGGVPSTCQAPNYTNLIAANARDYAATIDVLARRPDADTSRVLAVGISSGGATVVGLAGLNPRGLVGVINLAGDEGKLCDGYEPSIIQAMAVFGSRSRVPTLWIYSSNDSKVHSGKRLNLGPLPWATALHSAFTRTGGRAEFVRLGPVGDDGHNLTQGIGLRTALPYMERYLRTLRMPTIRPDLVEAAVRAGHVADSQRRDVVTYMAQVGEKALTVSTSGSYVHWAVRTGNLAAARADSLAACERNSHERCHVLMENYDIAVGNPAPPIPRLGV